MDASPKITTKKIVFELKDRVTVWTRSGWGIGSNKYVAAASGYFIRGRWKKLPKEWAPYLKGKRVIFIPYENIMFVEHYGEISKELGVTDKVSKITG